MHDFHISLHRLHTVVVDTDGRMYSFGQGSGGQLGLPVQSNVITPLSVDHDFSILPPRSEGSGLNFGPSSVVHVPILGTPVDPPSDEEPMDVESECVYNSQIPNAYIW